MVRVRALQACFVGNCFREAGKEFDYDGEINEDVMVALKDLEPVSKPTKPKAAAASKKKAKAKPPGLPNAVLPNPPKTDS